ncbi:lipid-A-disaccharide synthase N-terminal domain-containing protein [Actibacterium sp. MT2.3-13A]|uniref:lipid-A-disaccharide synthase N-terminal domain-containing protein n=1 Tax=Actibacterium sp. MT2.3-13A TaxID=2828332 RepID=UPI001BA5DC1F|nr:lipid-A-disaccharide synthase N-terminal domain-containing protein [Actibacterium sp. MT2.3-13A]
MDLLALFNVDTASELLWVMLGFAAQAMFGLRFIVQWLSSERAGKSVVPVAFWHFSVLGGVMMLSYAVYRWDPVFMLGQAMGLAVYFRNLWLISRSGDDGEAPLPPSSR